MADYRAEKYVKDSDALQFYYKRIDDIDTRAIGQRLRDIRTSLNLTLDEMSKTLSLSYGGLRKLEMGSYAPNGQTLVLLHEKYGIDLVWLLYGRHSTHYDILSALYAAGEDEKFDIFTRLYSYFITHDNISLVPGHGRCEGVEHFAEWDSTFYKPTQSESAPEGEVFYENSHDFDDLLSDAKDSSGTGDDSVLSDSDKDLVSQLLNRLMNNK